MQKNLKRGFILPLLAIGILLISGVATFFIKKHFDVSLTPLKSSVETNTDTQTKTQNKTPDVQVVQNTDNEAATRTTGLNTAISKVTNPSVSANQLTLAGNDLDSGKVPLGDSRYTTTAPKKGYIYLCNARKEAGGGGAGVDGPWIKGTTWNFLNKTKVSGSVSWSNATFSNTISSTLRTLTGNGLPINHTTGVYPIQSSDAAYQYDRNPNSIKTQSLKYGLPINPVYSETPNCMGGEVGMMLSGVPLFNGFDAELRDAQAHELQDSCGGHPQVSGEYHYHGLSSCFKDEKISTVLGYALDGFPITGPYVTDTKYLTTDDLDVCHGITSEIIQDGKKVTTYHYVMTKDFPYSVSCFRGKAIQNVPAGGGATQQTTQSNQTSTQPSGPTGGQNPPPEATSACASKQANTSCSFTSPRGDNINGACKNTPDGSFACVPTR